MQIAWSSAKLASDLGSGQVLEEIRACWDEEPICTSVVVTFWQRYLCKLAQAAIITRGCLVDPAKLVLKWMPLKADRVLPGELFTTMQACGWVMLSQVPKVFQPMNVERKSHSPSSAQVFEHGELVDYWSQRHGQWIEATVLKRHSDAQGDTIGYDLDVKLCAEVGKIRKKIVEPNSSTPKDAADLCDLVANALSEGWLSVEELTGAVKASGALGSAAAQNAWGAALDG